MTEFYHAGFQLVKVRAWMLGSLVIGAAGCWWGWDQFTTYGTRPADGGVLAPLFTRILIGGFIAGFALAVTFGLWIYAKLYVASLAWEPVLARLIVRTPTYFGTRTEQFQLSQIEGTSRRRGQFSNPVGVSVDAPWHALSIRGKRLSYIVDAQGRWLDPELARQLLKL